MDQDFCCQFLAFKEKNLIEVKELLIGHLKKTDPLVFKAGQSLFYQCHVPLGVFWVKHGLFKMTHQSIINHKTSHYRAKNEYFGLFHLLQNSSYCVNCVAEEDVSVNFFSKSLVQKILGTSIKSLVQATA